MNEERNTGGIKERMMEGGMMDECLMDGGMTLQRLVEKMIEEEIKQRAQGEKMEIYRSAAEEERGRVYFSFLHFIFCFRCFSAKRRCNQCK